MLGGKESPILSECKPIGISQTPGHNFQIASVQITAQDSSIALDIPWDDLARMRGCTKGDIGAGFDDLSNIPENIARLVISSHKSNVVGRHIAKIGKFRKPLESKIIGAHHAA